VCESMKRTTCAYSNINVRNNKLYYIIQRERERKWVGDGTVPCTVNATLLRLQSYRTNSSSKQQAVDLLMGVPHCSCVYIYNVWPPTWPASSRKSRCHGPKGSSDLDKTTTLNFHHFFFFISWLLIERE
jgi:hypothetical protein